MNSSDSNSLTLLNRCHSAEGNYSTSVKLLNVKLGFNFMKVNEKLLKMSLDVVKSRQ